MKRKKDPIDHFDDIDIFIDSSPMSAEDAEALATYFKLRKLKKDQEAAKLLKSRIEKPKAQKKVKRKHAA